MTRWLLLILLTGVASSSSRELLSIGFQDFWNFLRKDNSANVIANGTETTVCDSEACRDIAKYITNNMDKTVDPCDNFYQFACGKFPENNPIPPHMAMWSTWTVIRHNINQRLRSMLDTDIKKDELLPIKFAKKWFRSCVDEKKIEELGLEPVEALLHRIGGWPMTMDDYEWHEDVYPWYRVERYFLKLSGIVSIFQFEVAMTDDSPGEEKYQIDIFPPTLPLWEEIPLIASRQTLYDGDSYKNLIVGAAMAIAKLRRATVTKESIMKDAEDIIDFEKQLYRIVRRKKPDEDLFPEKYYLVWSREGREVGDYDMDIGSGDGSGTGSGGGSGDGSGNDDDDGSDDDDEDRETAKARMEAAMKFRDKIQAIINDLLREKDENVDKFWEVAYVSGAFFLPLMDLIERTPMRTIVNYIHWNFVSYLLKYTTVDMRELQFEVVKRYGGLSDLAPRWEGCITEMKMNDILSYVYVKKYFSDDVKHTAKDMITAVKKQFNNEINECKWLRNDLKEALTKKLDSMAYMVGYPSWYDNATAIANYYKGLIIGHGLLDDILNYMKFEKIRYLHRRVIMDSSSTWNQEPLTVTGRYDVMRNTFVIPAADFEQPFFSLEQPDYVNFGAVGAVLGHEIMHAFDPNVRAFDQNITWPEDMEKEYIKREQCFIEQYNKYSMKIPGTDQTIPINGLKTLGENVADSGLQAQYRAFRQWMLENRKPHVVLPGLEEYTDDQLFFLAFGNVWCETIRPDYLKYRIETDEHSMRPLRVIGTLSNSEEFARVYNCPPGSPMNPTTKCNIWK